MSVTALKIEDKRIKFMTFPEELITSENGQDHKNFITIDLRICDENFIPSGVSSYSVYDGSEEDYHKTLRIEAHEKGHFIPEESTNPEWNPDYKEEDFINTEDI